MKDLLPLFFTSLNLNTQKVRTLFRTDNPIVAGPGGFTLPPLEYAYDALEPYIDKQTMVIHHTKHHQTYVDRLNAALAKYPDLYKYSLEELLTSQDILPDDIRTAVMNNGGGHYNHSFFWKNLTPYNGSITSGALKDAIIRDFGSFENFKNAFRQASLSIFGSGWAWLVKTPSGKLEIITTANQDTPLALGLTPLLALDLWEHAYYLKHQNLRSDYIFSWFNIVDWEEANRLYSRQT